ncbi:SusD/RagB family nutrient-binding outer membrane lipoprotein [Chishuiella sp.]|uniref:SusD/RagB family nutrient-binding outer membrane lipoprotein n=1 Tax=Chishuiella sp. TaxID=1969467 RepID=UPI0028A7CEDC|nr:SusD/RagB family nutrient-binding outer membrane lipoprotein [Chishuiella sp.]
MNLLKQEIAQRGFGGDVKTHYNVVNSTISFWTGVNPESQFLEQDKIKYDGTLERIIDQKYFALFFTDYQQWYEYRRTGFLKLPKTSSMLNDGKLPRRLLYPAAVGNYNPKGYQQAIQQMGADDINTRVW